MQKKLEIGTLVKLSNRVTEKWIENGELSRDDIYRVFATGYDLFRFKKPRVYYLIEEVGPNGRKINEVIFYSYDLDELYKPLKVVEGDFSTIPVGVS